MIYFQYTVTLVSYIFCIVLFDLKDKIGFVELTTRGRRDSQRVFRHTKLDGNWCGPVNHWGTSVTRRETQIMSQSEIFETTAGDLYTFVYGAGASALAAGATRIGIFLDSDAEEQVPPYELQGIMRLSDEENHSGEERSAEETNQGVILLISVQLEAQVKQMRICMQAGSPILVYMEQSSHLD
jgi:hypothetical protein